MTDTSWIDEIEARAKAATAGEWRAKQIRYGAWAVDTELMCINGLKAWFGVTVVHAVDDHERLMTEGGKHDSRHDANFVAHARTDIPRLTTALRDSLAREKAMRDALNVAAPAIENLATCQKQLDADGCMVGVSRQAIDETLAAIRAALAGAQP